MALDDPRPVTRETRFRVGIGVVVLANAQAVDANGMAQEVLVDHPKPPPEPQNGGLEMRRCTTQLLTATLLLAGAHATHAQTAADSAAIRSTALDYIEGWYEGDAERMERSLHPHLAKHFQERLPDGSVRLTETTALELVQQVRNGGGSDVPAADRRTDVRILDVFQHVASVRVDAHGWIDYMHIARVGEAWKIVNVLWEIRR